jgi:hypothetical protein
MKLSIAVVATKTLGNAGCCGVGDGGEIREAGI